MISSKGDDMRFKSILVRIIAPEESATESDAAKAERVKFVAPPHRQYTDSSREQVVEKVINYLDKKYPTLDFRIVDVGKRQINFICTGERE